MEIKFLQEKDALSYKELRLYSLKESPFSFSDSYEDQKNKSLSDFQNEIIKIDNPLESFTLGAFNNENQLIGFVKFKRDGRSKARHRASLYSLYVKPDYRKNGIGRKLVEELLNSIINLTELKQLQLSTIITKDSLVNFYRSFGFKKLGGIIRKDLIIDNQYVDAIYMVKHLNK